MAGEQYMAICEETTRGTKPTTPTWLFYPLISGLQPKFNPNDESKKEFKGANTALGDSTVTRKSSDFSDTLEAYCYPGAELGLILKHGTGYAGSRSVIDTTAYKGILYPVTMPYGTGMPLANTAIGLCPNTDEAGTTKSQYWGGYRPKSLTFAIKPGEEVKVTIEGGGAGPWVGDPDQTAISGLAWPAAASFHGSDAEFYIASGISRTGVAPNFTDIDAGTMQRIYPDDFSLKLTLGLEDAIVGNGVRGPSKSKRTAQALAEVDITIDYEDPSSGFSSADEYKTIFSGPRTNSLLIILNNGELAGAATENYRLIIDLPLLRVSTDGPERNSDGKTPPMKMKFSSLYSDTTKYPFALMTVDQADAY